MGEVRDERVLEAASEAVWEALSTADGLLGWFWPPRLEPQIEVDLRVGGRYRIASPVIGMAVSGQYTVVQPPSLLGFGWQWDGEEHESAVTVALTPAGRGTSLVVTHRELPDSETDNHAKGWSDCLDRLPDWLAGR